MSYSISMFPFPCALFWVKDVLASDQGPAVPFILLMHLISETEEEAMLLLSGCFHSDLFIMVNPSDMYSNIL